MGDAAAVGEKECVVPTLVAEDSSVGALDNNDDDKERGRVNRGTDGGDAGCSNCRCCRGDGEGLFIVTRFCRCCGGSRVDDKTVGVMTRRGDGG